MTGHGVYMVWKDGRYAISYNKRQALKIARREGAAVYRHHVSWFRDGGEFGWDVPTFRTTAIVIADYR
jgi:hypothetical protein